MSVAPLELSQVRRAFGATEVIRDLTLRVERHEFLAIVGPSGCGKTTLLNLLAGHERPDGGTIARSVDSRMIHQQSGLFPWLTVAKNVEMGLALGPDAPGRLAELLSLVRLTGFAGHYPHQLSGGMRQRAELARALGSDAELLLLDEPFSALDYQTRSRLRQELLRLLTARPRTVVLVTHDIEEAVALADRVLVLGERPAWVKRELRLTGVRPRAMTDPAAAAAVAEIHAVMGLESDLPEPEPARAPAPARARVRAGALGLALALGLFGLGWARGLAGPPAPAPGAPPAAPRESLRVGHLPVT